MHYATLSNNQIHYAPNPLRVGDSYIGNPPDEVYVEAGYLPVIETDPPETDAQNYAEPHWVEQNGQIVQTWALEELPPETDIPAEEALDIIMGGTT